LALALVAAVAVFCGRTRGLNGNAPRTEEAFDSFAKFGIQVEAGPLAVEPDLAARGEVEAELQLLAAG
jgi:hypothetical protein